jgi:oxygen-dependent protoporphyrinogen oxidase
VRRVAILGGGIAGLSAAYYLREATAASGEPVEIVLLERSERLGGCLETDREGDALLELGPDSLVTTKPWAMDLLRALRLEGETIGLTPGGYAGVLRGDRIVPLNEGFRFFTPTSLRSLATSGLLSTKGLLRAACEPFVPKRRSETDESLASFVTRRLGREVLDRLAQPLIGGVYSGDPASLSMRATLPQFVEYERKYGSLVRAMRAIPPPTRGSVFTTLKGGLGVLVEALATSLGDIARVNADVESATYDAASGWTIACADGATVQADAVICALPSYAAAKVLTTQNAPLARALAAIRYHSIATVTLAFDCEPAAIPPTCYGFVVPFVEGRSITACTIVSRKYSGRAPDGTTLVRAFVGGALQPEKFALDDDAMLAAVLRDVRDLLGIDAPPSLVRIRRWAQTMPEYRVGHVALVDSLERSASEIPNIALAGAAYRGSGVPDTIRTARTAAERVAALLTSRA